MTVHGHFQRDDGARHRIADFRPRAAIDDIGRQVQQQIDQPRRFAAIQQIAQQLVLLRTNARQAGDQRKQRIEDGRAHERT